VDIVEPARANERHLAAAALLRGCADGGEPARELVHHRAHADGCGDADHRDEVVPAGMADLGERVVLLEDRDRWSGRSALRVAAIGGLDVLVSALNGEARAFEKLGDPEGGFPLLVCELRLGVNGARQREERIAPLVDRLDRALRERLRVAQCDWCPAMSARITRSSARSASSKRSAACSETRPRRRATFAISAMKRARKNRNACVPSPSDSPCRRASTPYSRPSTSACAMSWSRPTARVVSRCPRSRSLMRTPRSRNQRSESSSKRPYQSWSARSTRTRLRNSAETRSGASPSAESDWRRA